MGHKMTSTHKIDKTAVSNLQTDLNNKAETSLSNLSPTGRHYVAFKGYDSTATYSLNEVVMTIVSDSIRLYQSLVDNNTYVLSDTTKWKEVELGGAIDIDNSTITLNSNDEIQTVGVIDNRSGSALKLWTGTRSQYNAIQNKDANTLYNITDDTGDLGTFANTDLSNLSNTGKAHFANPALTNSPYTTNRILEIPQDIKLELNNGTLTLKAGSKVYVPNGFESDGTTLKFDVVIVETDVSVFLYASQQDSLLVYYNPSTNAAYSRTSNLSFSGTSAPTGGTYMAWYDTTNNVVKTTGDSGSTWTSGIAFPIAKVTSDGSAYTSIEETFNGFGYIGSTVFALPGVKVQIPDGRNEDGTFKTGILTSNSVSTRTTSGSASDKWIVFNGTNLYLNNKTSEVFDEKENYWKYNGGKQTGISCLGSIYFDGTKVSSFTPYTVDSVANSNASNFSQAGRSLLCGLAFPSSHYIDLTLGASGTTYTAPANGWIVFDGTGSSSHWQLTNQTRSMTATWLYAQSVYAAHGFLPVVKGDVVKINYSSGKPSSSGYFRFVYAEGEN